MADTATYEPIATQTLASTASSITFSSIAASWTDLRLVIVPTSAAVGDIRIQFNGDTGTNYSTTILNGTGAGATSGSFINATYCYLTYTAAGTTTIPHLYTSDIFSYAGSTYKTLLNTISEDNNGSGDVIRSVSLWRSTAAITSLSIIGGTYAIGTTATLYGILKA